MMACFVLAPGTLLCVVELVPPSPPKFDAPRPLRLPPRAPTRPGHNKPLKKAITRLHDDVDCGQQVRQQG